MSATTRRRQLHPDVGPCRRGCLTAARTWWFCLSCREYACDACRDNPDKAERLCGACKAQGYTAETPLVRY